MIGQIFSLFLAILGLGFLIFIHELGHYIWARRVGMKVEVFSIGFGAAIYSWKAQGIRWQIGWIPLGGYVKIAGMQKEGTKEPHEIPNGFFGKSPWKRMQVAFMGPMANVVFAFVAFSIVWFFGGSEHPFSTKNTIIGYLPQTSEMYQKGVRPGDRFIEVDGKKVEEIKDLIFALHKKGDYFSFSYEKADTKESVHLTLPKKEVRFLPAQFLYYKSLLSSENPSLVASGIQANDRLVWADGEFLFSPLQLSDIVNSGKVYVTVQRKDEILSYRIPRVQMQDLLLTFSERAEFDDWQHEAQIKGKIKDLYVLPYMLSDDCTIEKTFSFLDESLQKNMQQNLHLEVGDRILAIEGVLVQSPKMVLSELQNRKVLLIVQREPVVTLSEKKAESKLEESIASSDIKKLLASIGTEEALNSSGSYLLLKPINASSPLKNASFTSFVNEYKKDIEEVDAKTKQKIEDGLSKSEKRLLLHVSLEDAKIHYHPSPFALFNTAVKDTYNVLGSLVSGSMSPKVLSGPIGIVKIVQESWKSGIKDALFWLGLISINLAVLNLLPIPVLDGGYILISLIEMITKKPLKAKTMEKIVLPFLILFLLSILFITYQDIVRGFFS